MGKTPPLPIPRSRRRAGLREGQGPRRERAQRAQAGHEPRCRSFDAHRWFPPSTRARPEQAGGGHQDDLDRMLRTETHPTGDVIVRTPDNAGRLDTVAVSSGLLDYDYYPPGSPNGAGKPSAILGPYGTDLHFTHDAFLTTSLTWNGDVSGSVAWQYNNDFNMSRETVTGQTGSSFAVFGYDSDRRLTCASPLSCTGTSHANALRLARSPQHGMITGVAFALTSETWTYNAFGEVARQVAAVAPSTPVVDITYEAPGFERDKLGRIVQKTENLGGLITVHRYTYDTLRRLTDVTINGALVEHFEYDTNGNRTLGYSAAAGLSHTGAYDDQDRLLSYGPWEFTYTANGELASKTNTATDAEWRYQYDVLGNLLSVLLPNGDLVEYIVDGMGRRVGKKKNGTLLKQWIYRDALKPAAELDGAGNVVSQFVYGARRNTPDYVIRSGLAYRVISDHLGSPRYVVNANDGSDVAFIASYSAFGEVTGTGLDWMPFGFAGGIYDPDTGATRFGARDYDASLGRWSHRDVVLVAGLQGSAYVYAANDPVNMFDPDGMMIRRAPDPFLTWMSNQADSWYEVAGENWLNGDHLAAIGPAAMGALVEFFPYALQLAFEAAPMCGTIGNNPRLSNRGTMTDLPGGRPAAKSLFRNLSSGESVTDSRMVNGGVRRTGQSGVQIRMNPDGTTRVDIPGATPETIHFGK
jgi:RHS repeat-associated protein